MSRPFYDYPALYDAIHLADTAAEAEGVMRAFAACRLRPGSLLEPACGTGRFLRYFADAGLAVTGYDVSRRALAFAKRRLAGTEARVVRASMTDYRGGPFDAAFSLIGTFRHLQTDRDALRHLRLTAASLRPGGVYVVGLDLVDYDDCPPDEEGWEVEHRGRRLQHLYETLPPTPRTRREKVINFITAGGRVLQDEYELRAYDAAQWRALIARSPFTLAGAFDASGARAKLTRRTRYALFALRRR